MDVIERVDLLGGLYGEGETWTVIVIQKRKFEIWTTCKKQCP